MIDIPNSQKAKFIYNPHAGKKRRLNPLSNSVTLEEIKTLLEQYQIPVDYYPTKYAKHATKLAHESIQEKYGMVIAAGGDGTVGEVINGLIGTDMTVAILPLGSVMNVARMLSIPLELEKAVEIIKIGRVRKIDVGSVTKLNGEKMDKPYYFLEQAGIGLDAIVHYYLSGFFDRHEYGNFFRIIKALFAFYGHHTRVHIDGIENETHATLVIVSNGPLGGPALELAPEAKLNDHKLTVSLFKMSKWELTKHLYKLFRDKPLDMKKVKIFQAEKVRIDTKIAKMVHTDSRLFGETPVEFKIVPSAVNVIAGFPKPGKSYLNKRTYLDL